MVDIFISLTGENGQVIYFDNDSFVLETGLRGFGIPNPMLRIDKSAGDGGVFRYSKRDVRVLDLPIVVFDSKPSSSTGSSSSSASGTLEEKLRLLAAILRGAVTLTATYSTGEAYKLVTYFDGGAETEYGSNANRDFCRWVISLRAPQPYWTSVNPQTFSVAATGPTRGLLGAPAGTTATLSALRVKASQTLGTVALENVGDVATPPTWVITGPASTVSVTLNGVGFSYNNAIAAGEVLTINTELGTVTDASGVNKYAGLGSAPKFFSIPAGRSTVSITATGSDSATRIAGYFSPRREVIH